MLLLPSSETTDGDRGPDEHAAARSLLVCGEISYDGLNEMVMPGGGEMPFGRGESCKTDCYRHGDGSVDADAAE